MALRPVFGPSSPQSSVSVLEKTNGILANTILPFTFGLYHTPSTTEHLPIILLDTRESSTINLLKPSGLFTYHKP